MLGLVITGRVLDTLDPKIYSYRIEQKPTTLEALTLLGKNVCEAHGISKIIKTFQTGLAQTMYQNPKQNSYKSGKQQNGNVKYDNKRNQNNDKSNQLYNNSDRENSWRDQQYKEPNVSFKNPNPSSNRKPQSLLTKKSQFGNRPYGLG